MNAPQRLAKLITLATVIVSSQGCDDDTANNSPSAVPDVQFRDFVQDGPGKLNTNYLGSDESYPLDNLPLIAGANPGVELLEIRARTCMDPAAGKITGNFSTASLGIPVVELSADGILGTLTLADVNNPVNTCTISAGLWQDTYWEIRVDVEVEGGLTETIETDLWLSGIGIDSYGSTAYEWLVNYPRVDPAYAGEIEYHHTCDEDPDAANPELAYHAYLIKDLEVTPASGAFNQTPNTMYLACGLGAVGKAVSWSYTPWDFGTDFHHLATNMVRADYCGNGVSYTAVGTELWLFDDAVYDTKPLTPYVTEAEWSLATGAATCVDMPRLAEFQQTQISCGGVPLPSCDALGLPAMDITTFVHDPGI